MPGAQGQLCQEDTVTQPTSFVPGYSHDNSAPRGLHQGRYHLSAQSFPENTGPYGNSFAGTSVGPVSHATHPGRHRVTVTRACVSALAYWRDPFWLKRGMILDMAHRRKVVTTDASNKGWGALCESKPTFGLWSYKFFLPDNLGHHVLIRSDSRSMVLYINHQGGLVSKRLCTLANNLLVWAQNSLHSLKAMHVPGKMNQGADMLSRNNVSSVE